MTLTLAEYLWAHMAGLYGHRWVSAFGADPHGIGGHEWSLVLSDLSREQIDAGLDACRRSGEDWPPSAPAFRARCFGIPSFERVRADVTTRRMPFTLMTLEGLDLYLFTHSTQRDAERMLRMAYDYAVARRLDGAELPELPVASIQHDDDGGTPVRRATQLQLAAHFARIKECLGVDQGRSTSETDPVDTALKPQEEGANA